MTKKLRKIRIVTAVLVMVMLLSTLTALQPTASGQAYYGSSPSISNTSGTLDLGTEKYYDKTVIYKLPDAIEEDDDVSIIIMSNSTTLLDAYDKSGSSLSFGEYILTDEAEAVRTEIMRESMDLKSRLNGISYTAGEDYNTVLSGFEIIIKAADFKDVCEAIGDDATVIIGEEYEACETQYVENNVNVYGTGIFNSQSFTDKYGFDGAGMVVAVLDTGIDYYHSAFLDKYFTTDRDKLGLTFSQVTDILAGNDMAAESMVSGLTASDLYISDKIPFAFDYADGDADVFPLLSNHGTHVSGVIVGNYLEHIDAEDYTGEFVGVAPGAQVVAMKIFSDVESTSHTSWILAALEDCVALGVDVINMSIGTTCGFSRENDKEVISGVYDKIRERGISLIVAASNSFNSAYGSDKNGNLPLTSNPDSSTVGSPSTYKGALSVASIEGAKTPYLTYKDNIMYFIESTDRFSEEKDFVNDLLGDDKDELTIEYVVVAGAGRTVADYTGLDVEGKIVLIKRGYNTFEEKVMLAEQMGAAGVIIYNNVSGDIKMNVGETKLPVCSISQNDGEMLAAAGSGTITLKRSQEAGPFISDFSSWGPSPDLEIKPEITAHGGSILSSVPGENYDRISGTSMATPNISGVTALLREYVINRFGLDGDKDAVEITAIVNRLMMSSADIIINKNGLPYSVRKQGAGLANLTDSAATNAYIVTYNDDQSIMDKSKIQLGDDPSKTGVYTLKFGIYNFGTDTLSYNLSAYVMTEGVSETKTAQGETTVTEAAYLLDGAKVEIASVSGGTKNGETISVEAGKTADVTVTITLAEENKKYLNDSFENGMYVEGYVILDNEDNTQDLNVPYLAFYGDWTKAPLFDLDYFETNADELDDSIDMLDKNLPDAYATRPIGGSTADYVSYLGSYYFEQNSNNKIIAADRKYVSISNQNANGEINSLRFVWAGMLRNAERVEVVITDDATGEVVFETTDYLIRKSYGEGGPISPAGIDIEFSAIDQNLKNNTSYTVYMKGYLDYGDGGENTNLNNEFSFPLVTDFSAPVLSGCEFYTEYDRSTKSNRLYAKIALYDNHYAMALQAGYVGMGEDGKGAFHAFDKYATPVYSEYNSTTYVVYELTDHIDEILEGSYNKNTFTIACYDYAMNNSTYEIELPDSFEAFYFAETKDNATEDEDDIIISPNEVYNLSPIVYPATQWGETITYSSSNEKVAVVVNNQLIGVKSGYARITATTADGLKTSFTVQVLSEGDEGYTVYSKPVANSFTLTGYYVNKAFYILDNTQRDIGSTKDERKFGAGGGYSLSMYPSESVTLRYELDAYFPNDTTVEFSSGNENIVKVDAVTGQITAVEEGIASVTAKVMMDGSSTLYSLTVNINVKEPFVTSGPSLTHYYGAGDNVNHVQFPSTLAITEIGQFAFSNYDYVDKGENDEISDEAPETMKMWFVGDDIIKSVVIPEGVTRIGPYAFANMSALEKIVLPSTLETIDFGAFYGCSRLVEVEGLENVKFINQGAFQGCPIGGTISLDNIVAIADYAFAGNSAVEHIILPETLQSIGAYAFQAPADQNGRPVSSLKSVEIKAEKIKLGQYAFNGCVSLKSISINAAVIPTGAFNECTSLKEVTIGKDVSVISEYAFRSTRVSSFKLDKDNSSFVSVDGGKYLVNKEGDKIALVAPTTTSLTVNNPKIVAVMDGAFSGCEKITEVNIPSVTYVGNYGFSECEKLTTVNLGDLSYIGSFAFENTAITSFEFRGDVTIGDYAFSRSRIKSVDIGNGLTIPEGAFANCAELTTVVIGNNVTVGEYAFYNDLYHADYYKEFRNTYNSATGLTESKEYAIYYVVYDGSITSLSIGNNVTLEQGAFYGAANLKKVRLGKGAVIGNFAFYNCDSLEYIDLSKVKSIGESAFSGDVHFEYTSSNYTSVDINENGEYSYRYYAPDFTSIELDELESIGKNAFSLCKNLVYVHLGDKLTEIDDGAFQNCDNLSIINLGNVTSIGGYAFAECDIRGRVNLASVEYVGEYAFCYNDRITEVSLAKENVKIDEGAFAYCDALAKLDGEENATSIGDYSFAYTMICEADLTDARYIGTHAFYKDKATKFDLTLGTEIEDIGDNPFAFCILAPLSSTASDSFMDKEYTSVVYTFDLSDAIKVIDGSIYRVVPNGLELITWMGDDIAEVADNTVRIGAMAFAGSDVKQVVLPYTLKSIGHKAFYACDELIFVSFSGYQAPVLEEEYDSYYYESMEHIPAIGDYDFVDYYNNPIVYSGNGTINYFMWNVTDLPGNFFYGANFVDYVGYVEDKITMIRPSNGKGYDSFILNQYFSLAIDGAVAADEITLAAIEALKTLPDDTKDISLANKHLVVAARAAYDKIISDEQRALVPESILKLLTAAEQKISDLEYLGKDEETDTPVEVPEEELDVNRIVNIVMACILAVAIVAFVVVLFMLIELQYVVRNKWSPLVRLRHKIRARKATKKSDNHNDDKKAEKLDKAEPPRLADYENIVATTKGGALTKRRIATVAISIISVVIIAAGIVWFTTLEEEDYFAKFDEYGRTVTISFDSNGGTFKGSDSSFSYHFTPEEIGENGITFLAPDDERRGSNDIMTFTKAGHFLAGWYTGRELIDPNDPEKGYTYYGKWDFDNDKFYLEDGKEYTASESALTLYAAWVPYYSFEIYEKDANGNDVLIDTVSALSLTIPEWKMGDVTLNMDNFPVREGYTLKTVDYDINQVKVNESETRTWIEGRWSEETATLVTPTIKIYTTWEEGDRYHIYTVDDLRKNADVNGYYEILADLDFANTDWPSAFTNGKFAGKIFGNGHTLSNVKVESTEKNRINNGIFGTIDDGAYIENLNFENLTHTLNLMIVAEDATFGLLAGVISENAVFDNVSVTGNLLIGDHCANLAGADNYVIGKLAGTGNINSINANVDVQKVNPDNIDFDIEIGSDGYVSIIKVGD